MNNSLGYPLRDNINQEIMNNSLGYPLRDNINQRRISSFSNENQPPPPGGERRINPSHYTRSQTPLIIKNSFIAPPGVSYGPPNPHGQPQGSHHQGQGPPQGSHPHGPPSQRSYHQGPPLQGSYHETSKR
eukprot:GHVL01002087.1.p1 GENE.GHVL01002087.1~~GHVL01002087.1.p1  ORF type:complete len:146 (+),score=45.02 GHVL01002087.1:49-438(+)